MGTSSRLTRRLVGGAAVAAGTLVAVLAPLTSHPRSTRPHEAIAVTPANTGVFSWLRPERTPVNWISSTNASGHATLHYPSMWHSIPGDSGTVTAAIRDRRGLYRGYLNVTPQEGAERLGGWAAYRLQRNRDEGDKQVREVTAAEHLRFTHARGSCVIDDYLSRVGSHRYRELACIVAGRRFTNVFVGATLLPDWPARAPVVERAAATLALR